MCCAASQSDVTVTMVAYKNRASVSCSQDNHSYRVVTIGCRLTLAGDCLDKERSRLYAGMNTR